MLASCSATFSPMRSASALTRSGKTQFKQPERDVTAAEGPGEADRRAEQLNARTGQPRAAVQQHGVVAKQGDGQRAPHAAEAMHRNRADDVVDLQPFEQTGAGHRQITPATRPIENRPDRATPGGSRP